MLELTFDRRVSHVYSTVLLANATDELPTTAIKVLSNLSVDETNNLQQVVQICIKSN